MNRAIRKGGPIKALGAMSGTSLDGVDTAVVETDGHRIIGFGPSGYRAYTDAERADLRAALGHWHGPAVDKAAELVTFAHAEALSEFEDVDLIGFHGQTLAHEPSGRGTLQVGDGKGLAQALGVPVVWDFRSDDVAMGGEGAPLAPFFHFACAKWIGATEPLCFLNLGGVGNLTYVDPSFDGPETPGALLAFDTGPANAPVDDLDAGPAWPANGPRRRGGTGRNGRNRRAGIVSGRAVLCADAAKIAGPQRLCRDDRAGTGAVRRRRRCYPDRHVRSGRGAGDGALPETSPRACW